ncbi:RDD family protein [Streptomyces sp. XM4193]|uniref:RDD family protein n=1 Tax=Streptomyces sp. XM4193 TaxID=2929782 RepID=UPI001FF92DA2|nr:RDD family protein [Streptomyces sp. XM4193]MCK1796993.1 RDD family protein [Streptomyces sp. XM4193]
MSELVTGDAVVLGLQPARLPSRAIAVLIDLAVLWTAYVLLTVVLLTAVSGLDEAAAAAVAVGLLLTVLIGVPVAVETLTAGRSLGKVVCGLRVVREDGGPVRFRHALVRGLVGFVELQMTVGTVACAASLVSARGRRLGDVFAGTLVVRERSGVAARRAGGGRSAQTEAEAVRLHGLNLSSVPDSLWLAVRQYLLRAPQLDPAVRQSMGERLAGDVAEYSGDAAPAGPDALGFLVAVVAERRARDRSRPAGSRRDRSGAGGEGRAVATGPGAEREEQLVDGARTGSDVRPAVAAEVRPSAPEAAPAGDGQGSVAGDRGTEADGDSRATGFVPPA